MATNRFMRFVPVLKNQIIQQELFQNRLSVPWLSAGIRTSAAMERARQHTRKRKQKIAQANRRRNLAKMEDKPKGFIPFAQRDALSKTGHVSPRKDFSHLLDPPEDDVYIQRFFKWRKYSIAEALDMHREIHAPSILNLPDSLVFLTMELSLKTEKRTKFHPGVSAVVDMPHKFASKQRRNIAVVTDVLEEQQMLEGMPFVNLVVGAELARMVKSKEVVLPDYEYVVCNVSMMQDMMPYRQQLKRKFPSVNDGTATSDPVKAVEVLTRGVKFESVSDKHDLDYAKIVIPVGHLNMSAEEIEDNIGAVLNKVQGLRPQKKTTQEWISMVRLISPPSKEQFDLNYDYLFHTYLEPSKPQCQEENAA